MEEKTFKDDYEHPSEAIEYILENLLQDDDGSEEFKSLRELFNSSILNNCNCASCTDESCSHGINYKILDGELVLTEDRRCQDLIYECNDSCRCVECHNKLVQFGPRDNLEIIQFASKGSGLASSKLIQRGSFICEYAGEVLTKCEAIRRDQQNQAQHKMNYIFCLNEINSFDGSKIQTFVDPSYKGNIGRYINHSCDANCDVFSTRVDSLIPKIAIFANRDIPPLTEITFNYGSDQTEQMTSENSKSCKCNSHNCRLYLPNFTF